MEREVDAIVDLRPFSAIDCFVLGKQFGWILAALDTGRGFTSPVHVANHRVVGAVCAETGRMWEMVWDPDDPREETLILSVAPRRRKRAR